MQDEGERISHRYFVKKRNIEKRWVIGFPSIERLINNKTALYPPEDMQPPPLGRAGGGFYDQN